MVECEECGKTLGIFKSYQHPTMGKKHNLCSSCFDQVNESVNKWREFVISNSFKYESPKNGLRLGWNNMLTRFSQKEKIFDKLWTGKENYLRR